MINAITIMFIILFFDIKIHVFGLVFSMNNLITYLLLGNEKAHWIYFGSADNYYRMIEKEVSNLNR